MIAIIKTNIPIPPMNRVKLLQKRRELLRTSISGITVAPVVVNPLTISNTESIYEGTSPLIHRGRAPNSDINIQERETIANPSFVNTFSSFGFSFGRIFVNRNIKSIVIAYENFNLQLS